MPLQFSSVMPDSSVAEVRFYRNPNVEAAPLQSETVLFNPTNNKFCVLNTSAALLWNRLEQPRTIEELASELCSCFDVEQEPALHDVHQVVHQFLAVDFVKTTQQTTE